MRLRSRYHRQRFSSTSAAAVPDIASLEISYRFFFQIVGDSNDALLQRNPFRAVLRFWLEHHRRPVQRSGEWDVASRKLREHSQAISKLLGQVYNRESARQHIRMFVDRGHASLTCYRTELHYANWRWTSRRSQNSEKYSTYLRQEEDGKGGGLSKRIGRHWMSNISIFSMHVRKRFFFLRMHILELMPRVLIQHLV